MNLASPRMGKHQYFHVPAHVARRHCLAGNIDEPNAAIEALDSVRFFNCRMADVGGSWTLILSLVRERGTSRVTRPLILFRMDYRLGNQAQGASLWAHYPSTLWATKVPFRLRRVNVKVCFAIEAGHWLVVEASRFRFGVVFKHYDHLPSVWRKEPTSQLCS